MIANEDRCILIQIGMAETTVIQLVTAERCNSFTFGTDGLHDAYAQLFCQNQNLTDGQISIIAGISDFHCRVFDAWTYRHSQIGRNGPRCGGPDDDRGVRTQFGRDIGQIFAGGELHIDGVRGVILIFHFRFSQCCGTGYAPVYRFRTLVEAAISEETADFTHGVGFKFIVHGDIGIGPVSGNAEPFELFTLHIDLPFGIFATFGAELGIADIFLLALLLFEGFFHLQLDRQAMAIPSRHIGCIKTKHGA